jgi:hypothetical protein
MTTFAKSQTPFGRPAFSWTLAFGAWRYSKRQEIKEKKGITMYMKS